MATVPDTCEFVVGPDKVYLFTNTNGNELKISNISAEPQEFAALTLLLNGSSDLSVEIKVSS